MPWPTLGDYLRIMANPGDYFLGPPLSLCVAEKDAWGFPLVWAGAFAAVFKVNLPEAHGGGSRVMAVRCFLRDDAERHHRYPKISQAFEKAFENGTATGLVPFSFNDGVIDFKGTRLPAMTMDWVEGQPLSSYVESNCLARTESARLIGQLATRFEELLSSLSREGIAHGDLQHGNILVQSDGQLRLVDYDGVYVPRLKGLTSAELGHPAYQHPKRTNRHFGPDLDRFAGLAVPVALRALAVEPDLWGEFNNDNNLLFQKADFLSPDSSKLFERLANSKDLEVRRLASALSAACKAEFENIPSLDQVLRPPKLDCTGEIDAGVLSGSACIGKALSVSNCGARILEGVVSCSDNWVTVNSEVFRIPEGESTTLGVWIDMSRLAQGRHESWITLRSNGGHAIVPIKAEIIQLPEPISPPAPPAPFGLSGTSPSLTNPSGGQTASATPVVGQGRAQTPSVVLESARIILPAALFGSIAMLLSTSQFLLERVAYLEAGALGPTLALVLSGLFIAGLLAARDYTKYGSQRSNRGSQFHLWAGVCALLTLASISVSLILFQTLVNQFGPVLSAQSMAFFAFLSGSVVGIYWCLRRAGKTQLYPWASGALLAIAFWGLVVSSMVSIPGR